MKDNKNYDNIFGNVVPNATEEWDYEANFPLTPYDFTLKSGKTVYRFCKKCGHKWLTKISEWSRGRGCPCCSGKIAVPGINDLKTTYPMLCEEWDYNSNGELTPENVTGGSNKKAFWICKKCGYNWQATIYSRAKYGNGCPYCAGKIMLKGVNDLKTNFKILCEEWDVEKNGNTPDDYACNSNKKAFWVCKKCGYNWQTSICSRVKQGYGCPCCANKVVVVGINDLATTHPDLAEELCFEENGGLTPHQITIGSNKEPYWKCRKCGRIWKARVTHRAEGHGCPFCAGQRVIPGVNDLATMRPDVCEEWDYEANGKLKPTDVMSGSGRSVCWKHLTDKGLHKWKMSLNNRTTNGQGCPICAKKNSKRERDLYILISEKYSDAEHGKKICNGLMGVFDIYIPSKNVLIEYDGAYYHCSEKGYDRDKRKNELARTHNYEIIRVREQSEKYKLDDIPGGYSVKCQYARGQSALKEACDTIFEILENTPTVESLIK